MANSSKDVDEGMEAVIRGINEHVKQQKVFLVEEMYGRISSAITKLAEEGLIAVGWHGYVMSRIMSVLRTMNMEPSDLPESELTTITCIGCGEVVEAPKSAAVCRSCARGYYGI